MRFTFCRAVAAAALLCSGSYSVFADSAAAKPLADISSITTYRGAAQVGALSKEIGANTATRNGATPSEAFANPYRAYPPSCLESPIPLGLWVNDPHRFQSIIVLPGDPLSTDATERAFSESVTITLFRVVCSSGKSALLFEIDRPNGVNQYPYPIVPGLQVAPTGVNDAFVPRISDDPNTFLATTYAASPLPTSDVFVFENVLGGTVFDYGQSLTLFVDNLAADPLHNQQRLDLAAYVPSQYAEASLPLKINGYLSGNWYDKNHSGEGIQTEIGEIGTASANRYLTVAWYTYGSDGLPYWLFGSGAFTIGDRSATVTLAYASNGGFAGAFGAKATVATWGTIVVNFPDCNTINFSYASTGVIPAPVPQGSGTKTWTRLSNLNGLTCQ